jgi:predicted small integral membrane protein
VIEARIAKIVMIGSLALYAFIVAFDNITDYDTNFEFVRHVLSMDTIFPGSALLYRQSHPPLYGILPIGSSSSARAPTLSCSGSQP